MLKKYICLLLYYSIARKLPVSYNKFFGKFSKRIRYVLCKNIFKKCGIGANIERNATFGNGFNVEIGNDSSIGVNAHIPNDTIIGNDVMMGPNTYILVHNHAFDRTDITMREQGYNERKRTIIEDDCWIGRDVLMTPGRTIKKGTIIAARCVLCKDFPEYSIVGGNPSKLIRNRKETKI